MRNLQKINEKRSFSYSTPKLYLPFSASSHASVISNASISIAKCRSLTCQNPKKSQNNNLKSQTLKIDSKNKNKQQRVNQQNLYISKQFYRTNIQHVKKKCKNSLIGDINFEKVHKSPIYVDNQIYQFPEIQMDKKKEAFGKKELIKKQSMEESFIISKTYLMAQLDENESSEGNFQKNSINTLNSMNILELNQAEYLKNGIKPYNLHLLCVPPNNHQVCSLNRIRQMPNSEQKSFTSSHKNMIRQCSENSQKNSTKQYNKFGNSNLNLSSHLNKMEIKCLMVVIFPRTKQQAFLATISNINIRKEEFKIYKYTIQLMVSMMIKGHSEETKLFYKIIRKKSYKKYKLSCNENSKPNKIIEYQKEKIFHAYENNHPEDFKRYIRRFVQAYLKIMKKKNGYFLVEREPEKKEAIGQYEDRLLFPIHIESKCFLINISIPPNISSEIKIAYMRELDISHEAVELGQKIDLQVEKLTKINIPYLLEAVKKKVREEIFYFIKNSTKIQLNLPINFLQAQRIYKLKIIENQENKVIFKKPSLILCKEHPASNVLFSKKWSSFNESAHKNDQDLFPKGLLDQIYQRKMDQINEDSECSSFSEDCHNINSRNDYPEVIQSVNEAITRKITNKPVRYHHSDMISSTYKKVNQKQFLIDEPGNIENFFSILGSYDCGWVLHHKKFLVISKNGLLSLLFTEKQTENQSSQIRLDVSGQIQHKKINYSLASALSQQLFYQEVIGNNQLALAEKIKKIVNWQIFAVKSAENRKKQSSLGSYHKILKRFVKCNRIFSLSVEEDPQIISYFHQKQFKFQNLYKFSLTKQSSHRLYYYYFPSTLLGIEKKSTHPHVWANFSKVAQNIHKTKTSTYGRYYYDPKNQIKGQYFCEDKAIYEVQEKKLIGLGNGVFIFVGLLRYNDIGLVMFRFYAHWLSKTFMINATQMMKQNAENLAILINGQRSKNRRRGFGLRKMGEKGTTSQNIQIFIKFLKQIFFDDLLRSKKAQIQRKNYNKYKYLIPNSMITFNLSRNQSNLKIINQDEGYDVENQHKRSFLQTSDLKDSITSFPNMISVRHSKICMRNSKENEERHFLSSKIRKKESIERKIKSSIIVLDISYEKSLTVYSQGKVIQFYFLAYENVGNKYSNRQNETRPLFEKQSTSKTQTIKIQIYQSKKSLIFQKSINWNDPANASLYNMLIFQSKNKLSNPRQFTKSLVLKLISIIKSSIVSNRPTLSKSSASSYIKFQLSLFFQKYTKLSSYHKKIGNLKTNTSLFKKFRIFGKVIDRQNFVKAEQKTNDHEIKFYLCQLKTPAKNKEIPVRNILSTFDPSFPSSKINMRMAKRITKIIKQNCNFL